MNLIQQVELTGASLVSQKVRAMARENILARLEQQEVAAVAASTLAEIDEKIAALRGQLPALALREGPALLAVQELNEIVISLTSQQKRAELDNDPRGANRLGEQMRTVERQRSEHEAQLRTINSKRADIESRLGNLEAARRELEKLL